MSLTKALIVCVLVVNCVFQCTNAGKAKVTLFHFNDINSQLKPFEKDHPSVPGSWGGFQSLIGLLKEHQKNAKEAGQNTIRIAAGNLIGGESGWLPIVGWEEFGKLISNNEVNSLYEPDVMGLGFKEFEAGLKLSNLYLSQWKNDSRKVLVSTAKCSSIPADKDKEQEKTFCDLMIKSSHIIPVKTDSGEDLKIGFVGIVNPLVEKLADPGALTFEQDLPAALQKVIDTELKEVTTVIAVGSGSMEIARNILSKVNKIRIVVLSGGTSEMTSATYPTEYGGGFIVKGGAFGKTFGKFAVEIDDKGKVTYVKEDSQLVDNNGGNDTFALNRVTELDKIINKATEAILGQSLVKLEASREKCWRAECNLGNLVADSMVHCALSAELFSKPEIAGTVGIWTSGSIFDDSHRAGTNISVFDVHKILPYHNRAYVVNVNGETLKKIFATSGGAIKAPGNGQSDWGQFLQVSSGIEVHYSTSGELKSLRLHHLNDSQPVLKEVEDKTEYDIVLPSFMARGRSVYDYIPGSLLGPTGQKLIDIGFDDDCVQNYIKGLGVLSVGFEQRITISDDDGPGGSCNKCSGGNTGLTVFLTLLIFLLIVGLVYVGWRFVWPRISQRGHTSHFP